MSNLPRPVVFAVICLIGCCFAGCPKSADPVRTKVPTALAPLLAHIASERAKVQSLEGSAKLRIYKGGKRRTLRLNYQIQRPNRIHLQVVAAAMQPVLIVTCDGKEFAIHNLLQREFLRGAADRLPQLLGEFLPTQIPLPKLIAALLGELPLLRASSQTLEKGTLPGLLLLLLKGPQHQQKVWIDAKKGQFMKTEFKSKKRAPLTLEYGKHKGKPPLPQRIMFIMPKRKQRVHWIFGSRAINPKLTIKNFQQKAPKGTTVKVIR